MRLPIGSIDPPDRIPAHHDFTGAGDGRAVFIADITDHPRVSSDALHLIGIISGQKLNASVVDSQPNLDLYELAGFLVGTEPLFRCDRLD